MKPSLSDLPLYFWFALAVCLFSQSLFLFLNARKRDAYPWFWGVCGLISFPLPTLLYLILIVKIFRRRRKRSDI